MNVPLTPSPSAPKVPDEFEHPEWAGWCYFPSTGQTKAGLPRDVPSTMDGNEHSLGGIFHQHGQSMSYSHTTYLPGGRTDA